MPLVVCPKCKTQLKIPDGASGNVKCPKCTTVFAVAAKPVAAPAFEVVDDAPPKPAPRVAAPPPRPAAPPPRARVTADEHDFEVVDDEPRSKKKSSSYDDDDDRPRKRRRDDDDDDYDDRPRSRRRRDDDDDDDDRPRKKARRRSRYEDDDYDDWQPGPGGGGSRNAAVGNAKVGVLLLTISFWLYFSLYCLFTLGIILLWAGVGESSGSSRSGRDFDDSGPSGNWVLVLAGIIGLGNWVVAAVGLGFCIAGPKKCRTAAITATSLAGAHIVLTAVSYSIMSGSSLGFTQMFGGGVGDPAWLIVSTTIPFLNSFLPMLFYGSRAINGEFVVIILAGVCELVRLIFVLALIKALAESSRNHDAADKAQTGIIMSCVVVGIAAVVVLFGVVLVAEGAFKSLRTVGNLAMAMLLMIYVAYTIMLLFPALAAGSTQKSLARRMR